MFENPDVNDTTANDSLLEENDDDKHFLTRSLVGLAFVFCLELSALLCFLGNAAILVGFAKFKEVREKRSVLLVGQAFVDCLMGLNFLLHILFYVPRLAGHKRSKGFCVGVGISSAMCVALSYHMMLFISLERLYAVLRPLEYNALDKYRICKRCIPAVVLLSAGISLCYLIKVDLEKKVVICNFVNIVHPTVYFTVASYGTLIMLATFAIYAVATYKFSQSQRQIDDSQVQSSQHQQMMSTEVKVRKTVTVLVVCYAAQCGLPRLALLLQLATDIELGWSGALVASGFCANGASNFFIYMWRHEDFKVALKKMLCCCKCSCICFNSNTVIQL